MVVHSSLFSVETKQGKKQKVKLLLPLGAVMPWHAALPGPCWTVKSFFSSFNFYLAWRSRRVLESDNLLQGERPKQTTPQTWQKALLSLGRFVGALLIGY